MELDRDQQAALQEIKVKMANQPLPDSSDEALIRWLTAKNFDVDSTEKALLQSLEWRKLNQVDEIDTSQGFEAAMKYFSFHRIGRDKFDCPIWFVNIGSMDLKGFFQMFTKKELSRFIAWRVEGVARELLPAIVAENNLKKTGNQAILLADATHLSMATVCSRRAVEGLIEIFKTLENNYQGLLRRAFVINASVVFITLFNLLKPFLNQATAGAFKIYGHDEKEWKEALLAEIDADQLPAYYGGTMTDTNGDPKCTSKVHFETKVPKSLYVTNNKPVPKEGMETVSISAGGKKKIQFQVDVAQSVLKWEFMTVEGDIGFRVYVKGVNGENVDILPSNRVESHLNSEEGQIVCQSQGTYVVEFDNSFNFLKSKKVHYFMAIVPPSEVDRDFSPDSILHLKR